MDKLWGEYVIMMNVSNELKELYRSGNGRKKLNISISGSETTITNSNIVSESMSIKQSLSDDENIKFGSCNSTSFEITVADITEDLIGKEIQPKLLVDSDTTELSLGLFTVESSKKEVGRPFRKITAYDRMKKLSVDVGEWYRGLVFPVTVKDLRDGLCGHVGLEQLETTLPFDSMEINKTLDDDGAINGLDLMHGICELNGCFGNISRGGKFEYVYLSTGDPVDTLNGILKSYPQCEDYNTSAIDGVTIKFTDSDITYQSTSHTNPYIITDNYLIADKTEAELISIANTIAGKINGISYRPATIESVGQPYFDLGDKVSFNDESGNLDTTYILKREINGIQALTDSIEASGEEYIQQDVNSVVGQLAKLNSDNGRLKIRLSKTEEGLNLKVSKGDVSSQLSLETEQITLTGNRVVVDSDKWKVDADGKQTCSDLTINGGAVTINNNEDDGIVDYIKLTSYKKKEGDLPGGVENVETYEMSATNKELYYSMVATDGTTGKSNTVGKVSVNRSGVKIIQGIPPYVESGGTEANAEYTSSGFTSNFHYGSLDMEAELEFTAKNGFRYKKRQMGVVEETIVNEKQVSTTTVIADNLTINSKDASTFSSTNITNKTNIETGTITLNKRYNSATITCTVSKIAQELGTSAGYALVGTLPDDCKPLYRIIDYHRFNGSYIGQIVIETTGEVKIGYTKKNDGTAANMPATSMYWTFTYTI